MGTTRRSIVGLCLVLLSLVGVGVGRYAWQTSRAGSLADLAAAVGGDLAFEPRLTGGFLPRADTAPTRAGSPAADRLSPDARIAIARLEKLAAADQSTAQLAALGVGYLVQGDVDRSIATLEDVTSLTGDASPLSDLSAAYLVKAERWPARKIEYLARALDAANRSLGARPSNEARFNRALAVEGLTPFVGEMAAWTDYLNTERDARWLAVARRRVSDARSVGDARASWDERQRHLRARLTDHDRAFVEESVTLFPEAAFEFFDEHVLLDWARAQASLDTLGAEKALRQAVVLADAIDVASRDPMRRDAIRGITALTRTSNPVRLQELAQAHLAYAEGVTRYDTDDYPNAVAAFERALIALTRARSPYRLSAEAQLATILFQHRNLDEADRRLLAVEDAARAADYRILLGRTLWLRGLVQSKQWRLPEALAAFRAGASSFEAAGHRENAAGLYSVIAANLRMLGEHHESWEYIGKTLERLWIVRRPINRYLYLFNASLFASSQDLLEASALFQNAAVREARARGGAPVVEALTNRAMIFNKQGDYRRAQEDVREAVALLETLPDGPLKRYEQAEIDVLTSELPPTADQSSRIDGLTDAIAFFSTAEPSRVPRLYLGLARVHRAAQATDAAEQAFARGIARLEEQQSRLGDDAYKISYFDDSWSLFPEMVEFEMRVRHDVDKAFEYAERSRARSLLAAAADVRPLTLREIQAALPESVVMLYYASLSDRMLIWAVTRSHSRLFESPIQRDDLTRLVSRYRSTLAEDRPAPSAAGDALFDALIRPVASALDTNSTLVVVADGDLQRLPFATLRRPGTARYLVEDHATLMSPSASFFVAALSRARPDSRARLESALLVGNPASAAVASDLRTLPGAEAEVVQAARLYPRHEVLTGRTATKSRFVAAAPSYDVVHFGGHALVNAEYPQLSRLAFSSEGDGVADQSLFAYEISRMRFSRTRVVVLAACSTAVGAISRGEGVVSVARPFLAAGVPLVIASQWDVDDRATAELFGAFHRALVEGQDPVKALQTAQVSLVRSPDRHVASPRAWGAFIALGAAAP